MSRLIEQFHRCGRKVAYSSLADAYSVAAQIAENKGLPGKKLCVYVCRWEHPGCFHIGNRVLKPSPLKYIELTKNLKSAHNQLRQLRDANKDKKLMLQAYRDSISKYPRINKLLRRLGIQVGTIVERAQTNAETSIV